MTNKQKQPPGLVITATPIGNLGDISERAARTLKEVDLIACEDTRVTLKLLQYLGIEKPLWAYHDHNADKVRPLLLEKLRQGLSIALVSDAGTPLISDPGYKLVKDCQEAGIKVSAIPGPCAAIMALSMAGLPTDRFLFAGFPPSKEKTREDWLSELASIKATLVFYETAPRLLESLAAIGKILPGREIAVARELTKFFEELQKGQACELIAHYTATPPKGEICLLVAPPGEEKAAGPEEIEAMLKEAMTKMSAKDAAGFVAQALMVSKKEVYNLALRLKDG